MPEALYKLPPIYIEIQQPGDKGEFHVDVFDGKTRQKITENRLPEERSSLEYLYTMRLIETFITTSKDDDEGEDAGLKHRQDDLVRYGQSLYRDLFGKNDRFKKYLASQPHLKDGARLVLRLHSTASELWNTPWEYIHDGEQFLGVQPQYPIIRNLMDAQLEREGLDLNQLPCPLRILMIISHPKDASPLNVDTEIAMIRRAVKSAEEAGRIEIDFVEEGTLENLDKALLDSDYHILHYSGHGSISPHGSFLVMENEEGLAEPAYLHQVLPLMKRSKNLRFVFLSACKAGTITASKATSGIATGLLQVVPAVLAMQFSVADQRASVMAEHFYGSLGRGQTLEEALHVSRLAMHKLNAAFGDWGVPALYTHKPNMRLLDMKATVTAPRPQQRFHLSDLPTFDPFVGRHEQQRIIRAAIPSLSIRSIYIWGMAGIGKSALVRQVLDRAGRRDILEDVLVLRCDKMELPQIVGRIGQWITRHFPAVAPILADNSISPVERLQAAAKQVRGKRLALVLDGIDRVMKVGEDRHGEFPHPMLTSYFEALASAEWSILTIFTSRLRWSKVPELPTEHCKEIHLGDLQYVDTVFLLQNLEHLKGAGGKVVSDFFRRVGGHPLTMHYINDYLSKNPQRNPLSDPQLPRRLAAWWHSLFLADVLSHLKPAERDALRLLSVHGGYFDPKYVQLVANLPTIEEAEQMMVGWELLSMATFEGTDGSDVPWYMVPNLVETYITSQYKPDKLATAHGEVARVMQHHFYLDAVDRFKEIGGPEPNPKNEFLSALQDIAVMPKRMNVPSAHRYLQQAQSWHDHLREAGDDLGANEIALTMLPSMWILNIHEPARELVKTLAEKVTDKSEAFFQARFWDASYVMQSGKNKRALKILQSLEGHVRGTPHEKLLPQIFERMGEAYRNLGNHKEANRMWRLAMQITLRAPVDVVSTIQMQLHLGESEFFHGDESEAMRAIDDALNMLSKTERINVNWRAVALLYLYRGHIYRRRRSDLEALERYGHALDLGENLADGYIIAKSLESFGYTYSLLGQYDMAAQYLLNAVDVYEKIEDKGGLAVAQSRLAQVYDYKGNTAEAVVFCERALQLAEEHAPMAVKQTETLLNQLKRKRRKGA